MNRLKEYRQQAKLSQQALADKANCSRSYISAVELGNQKLTLKMARIFGKILHVDPYELLGADAIRYKGDFYTTLRSLLDSYFDDVIEDSQSDDPLFKDEEWVLYWLLYNLANRTYSLNSLKAITKFVDVLLINTIKKATAFTL